MSHQDSPDYSDVIVDHHHIQRLSTELCQNTEDTVVSVDALKQLVNLCESDHHNQAMQCLIGLQDLRRNIFSRLVELAASDCKELSEWSLKAINGVVESCPSSYGRHSLRDKLFDAGYDAVISGLREGECNQSVLEQVDRFMDMDMKPGEQHLPVDLNSHLDIFYAILKQVCDSECDQLFLNILQHLVQLENQEFIWNLIERLVHRGSLVETQSQADQLLRLHSNFSTSPRPPAPLAAPPPAPPLPGLGAAPPPPPLNLNRLNQPLTFAEQLNLKSKTLQNSESSNYASSECGSSDYCRAPSSISTNSTCSSKPSALSSPSQSQVEQVSLPQQQVPQPRTKLKTFAWNKVPVTRVLGGNQKNVWMTTAAQCGCMDIDFDRIDDWFAVRSHTVESPSSSSRIKKTDEVHLLAPKRSLNVNIFLKQFRKGVPELLQLILQCDNQALGLEKLRGLAKILPEMDEIESLNGYKGNTGLLASAEQFFLQLITIPMYRIRIEGMLLKEEFTSLSQYIKPALDALILAGQDIMTNRSLHEILYLTLMIGNYFNAGSYGGNAAGFKVSSLGKLMEIRANKPNITLVHLVATEAESRQPTLLHFPDQLKFVEGASKLSVETVRSDIAHLRQRTNTVEGQMTGCKDSGLNHTMNSFMIMAKEELKIMETELQELERLRAEVAEFFCEDVLSFKLEDCCRTFHNFSVRFIKAIDDNNQRQKTEQNRGPVRAASMDCINKMRSEVGHTESPLSAKYQALCSGRDITLTTYINACDAPPDTSPQNQLRKTGSSSGDILNFLSKASNNSYACGSITNRSGKKKGPSDTRDRTGSWRQRVEQLLQEDEEVKHSTSVQNLSIDKPLPQRTRTLQKENASIKSDSINNEEISKTPRQPRTWVIKRSERAQKSQSLNGADRPNADLGQLLDHHIQADKVVGSRRRDIVHTRTNIDDVVRHCEKSKQEIDRIGMEKNDEKSTRDSGIDHDVDVDDVDTNFTFMAADENPPQFEADVYIDMTLPNTVVSSGNPISRESNHDGDHWRSESSDQSDGNDQSPTHRENDEGFETESHSTVSSDQLDVKPECDTVTPKTTKSTSAQLGRTVSNRAPRRSPNQTNNTTPRSNPSTVPRNNLVRKFVGRISSPSSKSSTPSPAKSTPSTSPSKTTSPLKKESPPRQSSTPTRTSTRSSIAARTSKVTPKPDATPEGRMSKNPRVSQRTSLRKPADCQSSSSGDSPPQIRRKSEPKKPNRLIAKPSSSTPTKQTVPLTHPIKSVIQENKLAVSTTKSGPNKNVWDRLTHTPPTPTTAAKRPSPSIGSVKGKPISAFGSNNTRQSNSPLTKAWK